MSQIMPDFTLEPETLAEQFIDLGIDTNIEVTEWKFKLLHHSYFLLSFCRSLTLLVAQGLLARS